MYSQLNPFRLYKTSLLLAFVTLCIHPVRAQFIFKPKKPIETIQTTIDKYEGIQLKDSLPFSGIRILDSRYDTTNLGFHLDSYLVLKDVSLLAGLQHTMDKYYRSLYQAGRDTLIIQLENLDIQDGVIRDSAFAITIGYVKARIYKGRDSSYIFLGWADTLIQEKYNTEITYKAHKSGKHFNTEFWDYYLLRLYEAVIRKASAINDSLTLSRPSFTIEEIERAGLDKRDKPILKEDSLRPGFYRDFSEFVNNHPTFEFVNNEALKNTLEVMHYRVGKEISNEEPDTTYWGYCDGKKIFVRYRYDFFQLERKDAGFYIAPTLDARRQNINQGALNLLIGLALLAGSVAVNSGPDFQGFSAIPAPEMPMVILKSQDALVLGLKIDWDTGGISF